MTVKNGTYNIWTVPPLTSKFGSMTAFFISSTHASPIIVLFVLAICSSTGGGLEQLVRMRL